MYRAQVPILAVIGEKEVESGLVNFEPRRGGELGAKPIADAVATLAEAVRRNVEPNEV